MQVHEGVEDYVVEASQKKLSRMEQIISNSDRVRELVTDLIDHYEERENLVKGKAIIVAYSRHAAYKMYKEIIK